MSVNCNRDCFNCPYPDVPEECLDTPLTPKEMQTSREIARRSTREQRAKRRADYVKNRKRILARARERRMANPEKTKALRRARYLSNQEYYKACSRRYYREHKESRRQANLEYRRNNPDRIRAKQNKFETLNAAKYGEEQRIIGLVRGQNGLSQKELARLCGYSPSMVCYWENGKRKANWGALYKALPDLAAEHVRWKAQHRKEGQP